MIIVVLGGVEIVREQVISELLKVEKTLIQHLNVEALSVDGRALLRLETVFASTLHKMTNAITVVSGITKQDELNYLRNKGALICHCYGRLIGIYDQLIIDNADLFVFPESAISQVPKHVFCPSEIVSECFFRR